MWVHFKLYTSTHVSNNHLSTPFCHPSSVYLTLTVGSTTSPLLPSPTVKPLFSFNKFFSYSIPVFLFRSMFLCSVLIVLACKRFTCGSLFIKTKRFLLLGLEKLAQACCSFSIGVLLNINNLKLVTFSLGRVEILMTWFVWVLSQNILLHKTYLEVNWI